MIHPDSTIEIEAIPPYRINIFEYQPHDMDRPGHWVGPMRRSRDRGR